MTPRRVRELRPLGADHVFAPLPEEDVRAVLRIGARCASEAVERFRRWAPEGLDEFELQGRAVVRLRFRDRGLRELLQRMEAIVPGPVAGEWDLVPRWSKEGLSVSDGHSAAGAMGRLLAAAWDGRVDVWGAGLRVLGTDDACRAGRDDAGPVSTTLTPSVHPT